MVKQTFNYYTYNYCSIQFLFLCMEPRAIVIECKVPSNDNRITRDHLALTIKNRDPRYSTQDTSDMGTTRVSQEEKENTRIIGKEEQRNL